MAARPGEPTDDVAVDHPQTAPQSAPQDQSPVDQERSAGAESLRSSVPWGAVAGALSLLYVVWYVLDLLVLNLDPDLFNRLHRDLGEPLPRALFAVIFLGIVFHALDGLRRALVDLAPAWSTRDVAMRAGVRFVTAAVWIPVTLVLLWPAVRAWRLR